MDSSEYVHSPNNEDLSMYEYEDSSIENDPCT